MKPLKELVRPTVNSLLVAAANYGAHLTAWTALADSPESIVGGTAFTGTLSLAPLKPLFSYFFKKKAPTRPIRGSLMLAALALASCAAVGSVEASYEIHQAQIASPFDLRGEDLEQRLGAEPDFYGPDFSPEYEALMKTIAQGEGTVVNGEVQYNIRFGGARFDDYSTHPNIAHNGQTPAGAFQINYPTFVDGIERLGLFQEGFTPKEQRAWFVHEMQRKGISEEFLKECIENQDLSPVYFRMANKWSTLPKNAQNEGFYPKQEPHTVDELNTWYFEHLTEFQ